MNKAEEILNEYGCPEIPFDENVTMFYPSILSAMQEYGKYCAEQAFTAGFYEGQEYYPSTFSDFWSEFQSKEKTE